MHRLKNIVLQSIDTYFQHLTAPVPTADRLRHCKLVSHRGEHDNCDVFENTMPAFERACRDGVWGIELDVRWTRDLKPVVFHDPDTRRMFGKNYRIGQLRLQELTHLFPLVPTLADVIERFGRKVHLMLEIKPETYREPDYQCGLLKTQLNALVPGRHYHLISLKPAMFRYLRGFPSQICLPIAELNLRTISNIAIREKYGGILGHYLLINRHYRNRHGRQGQKIGTGFVASPNCLFRELNRGVEWIFSNSAGTLQRIINNYLQANGKRSS